MASLRRGGLRALASTALACFVAAGPAQAADKAACVARAEVGQHLHKQHKLVAAREYFLDCAAADCPDVVSQDCTRWLGEVDRTLASVVVRALGPDGQPIDRLRVLMDGALLSDTTTSTPITVDPGPHLIRYEAQGAVAVEERIVLADGDRGHVLSVAFQAVPAQAPVRDTRSLDRQWLPAASWILGGVGVAAVGGFAAIGLWGTSEEHSLAHTCAPYCGSQADPVRTKFVVADVALAVGIAAIGVAAAIAIAYRAGRPRVGMSQSSIIDASGLRW